MAFGQAAEVLHESRETLALFGVKICAGTTWFRQRSEIGGRASTAQNGDRLVVRDSVEPGAQGEAARGLGQGPHGGCHRALQRIVGIVFVPNDRAAVAIKLLVVAPVDRLERPALARRREARQALFASKAQRKAARKPTPAGDCLVQLHRFELAPSARNSLQSMPASSWKHTSTMDDVERPSMSGHAAGSSAGAETP
jgi:hypothetical protein